MRLRLLLAALLVGATVSCGDGGDTAEPAATTTTTSGSTTTTTPVDRCDDGAMLEIVERWIGEARLAPGTWAPDLETPFDDRTDTAENFRDYLGFDCALRATQTTSAGAERLLLAAWTSPRYGFVLQSTDEPSTPYAKAITFQLWFEQPLGEWIDDQFVWASTLAGGESILIGTEDYSIGSVAKDWQSEYPPLPPGDVTVEAQGYAIDTLDAMGMHGATVAEEASPGSEIGSVWFVSRAAQIIVVTIGPDDVFDPSVPILTGPTRTERIGSVDVRVTEPGSGPMEYDVGDVGFVCDGWAWRLMGGYGTADELADVARQIIEHVGC
jgi:hypothetical protein